MIKQKIDYIHANPVRGGLCKTASEYRWTSFRSFYFNDPDPLMAVDKDWWWEGDEEKLVESVKRVEAEKRQTLTAAIEENRRRGLREF